MFRMKSFAIGVLLVATSGCAAIAGTSGIASASRTGIIHDVSFAETMSPANLRVQPGDEIRWVNQRSTPVTVEFLADALKDVSCQAGFSSFLRRQQETATIEPNETASLCFSKTGTVTYNARMDSPVVGGQVIESGTIRIGQ